MSTPFAIPQQDPRVTELLSWAEEHDRPLPLPLPIATIIELEDAGCIIDLDGDGTIYGSEATWLAHLVTLVDEVGP